MVFVVVVVVFLVTMSVFVVVVVFLVTMSVFVVVVVFLVTMSVFVVVVFLVTMSVFVVVFSTRFLFGLGRVLNDQLKTAAFAYRLHLLIRQLALRASELVIQFGIFWILNWGGGGGF